MSQLFSTERFPASDRIDAWQWNAQQICGDCRIQLPKSYFKGSIEIRCVEGLPLTRFSSTPLSFWKWPSDAVNTASRSCIVICQVAGVRCYRQNGAEVLLRPGDSTLIDSGSPWSSSCGTNCVRLYLRVPRWMMEDRLRTHGIPVARKISGDSGTGATLFRLSMSLYDDAEWMKEELGAATLDTYFEILSSCLSEDYARVHHGSALNGRILQFIDSHISEATLGPVQIASAMGISVRHLHRLFSATGKTIGDHMREQRLKQCRKDLADPRLRDRTITEIAFSRGFSDAAHFSHSFRKQFGISARAFRAQTSGRRLDPDDDSFIGGFARPELLKPHCRPN